MDNNDRVYDYMAAAEESIKQMDLMVRQVPEHIKTALVEEYRKSPWVTELPKSVEKLENVIAEGRKQFSGSQQSNRQLRQMVWATVITCVLVCGTVVAMFLGLV